MEEAHTGTLFLDEIGELPLRLQAKLLRALEEKNIRRVGSNRTISVDTRVIAATNRDLASMVNRGEYREDLYYRLNVIPVYVPALRDRKEDIPLLAERFLNQICRELHRPLVSLSTQAAQALYSYHWPGNVRELQNVLERAVYLSPELDTQIKHIYLDHSHGHPVRVQQDDLDNARTLKEQMEEQETAILREALRVHPSIRKAASQLGISHTALLKKIKKYGLDTK